MKKRTLLLGLLALAAVLGGVALVLDGLAGAGLGTGAEGEDGDPTWEPAARMPGEAPTAEGGARLQGAGDGVSARTTGTDAARTTSDAGPARVDLVRGAWLDAYRSKTSPATVEGLILIDAEPIREGRVLIHRVGREARASPLDPEADDVLVLPVDGRESAPDRDPRTRPRAPARAGSGVGLDGRAALRAPRNSGDRRRNS